MKVVGCLETLLYNIIVPLDSGDVLASPYVSGTAFIFLSNTEGWDMRTCNILLKNYFQNGFLLVKINHHYFSKCIKRKKIKIFCSSIIIVRESFPRQVDKESRGPQGERGLEFSRRKKGQTFFLFPHSLGLYNNNVSCLRTVFGLNLLLS